MPNGCENIIQLLCFKQSFTDSYIYASGMKLTAGATADAIKKNIMLHYRSHDNATATILWTSKHLSFIPACFQALLNDALFLSLCVIMVCNIEYYAMLSRIYENSYRNRASGISQGRYWKAPFSLEKYTCAFYNYTYKMYTL